MTKPVYVPYVSKSDRPKGEAKQLKKIGLEGNVVALHLANELLSPKFPSMVPPKQKNQRQIRKEKRQIK